MVVVGDIFKNLCDEQRVLNYSDVIDKIKLGDVGNVHLALEQGICEDQYQEMLTLLELYDHSKTISISSYFDEVSRCPANFTHKSKVVNTLISDPGKLDDKNYYSYLLINENCADLSDHVTGQHLQGMLLMEAARQMTLAITEKYFIEQEFHNKVSFITHSSEIKFHEYAFPVSTRIDYRIIKHRGVFKNTGEFTVAIGFVQNEIVVSECYYKFSVLDKKFVCEKEKISAKSIINNLINFISGKYSTFATA